jgi:hypothetical protein
MLEVGFGCGHHNHGSSARMWKSFFEDRGGPGVSLYEIDFGPLLKHELCVAEFKKTYPKICDGIFMVRKW